MGLILAGFSYFIEEVEYSERKMLPLMHELETQCATTSGVTNTGARKAEAVTSVA